MALDAAVPTMRESTGRVSWGVCARSRVSWQSGGAAFGWFRLGLLALALLLLGFVQLQELLQMLRLTLPAVAQRRAHLPPPAKAGSEPARMVIVRLQNTTSRCVGEIRDARVPPALSPPSSPVREVGRTPLAFLPAPRSPTSPAPTHPYPNTHADAQRGSGAKRTLGDVYSLRQNTTACRKGIQSDDQGAQ